MSPGPKDVWLFRIVHQDTGKPAQGVPVTVLDKSGNAAGHWVSDAGGLVAIPRRDTPRLRIRVGLRSEDPIELTTATLGDQPTPLAAPTQLPPFSGSSERQSRDATSGVTSPTPPPAHVGPPPSPTKPADPEVPGHVLYFQRLAVLGDKAANPPPAGGSGA